MSDDLWSKENILPHLKFQDRPALVFCDEDFQNHQCPPLGDNPRTYARLREFVNLRIKEWKSTHDCPMCDFGVASDVLVHRLEQVERGEIPLTVEILREFVDLMGGQQQ
jgi:hypothetical protein